jgi:hypothetical protein
MYIIYSFQFLDRGRVVIHPKIAKTIGQSAIAPALANDKKSS